jgi:argonaute-like protein implicated in RNA metabolism and viral defense
MPELTTYPAPHVPQPFEVRTLENSDPSSAAREVFDLVRMNWNSADIRGKWPVTLSYSRKIERILDEYGQAETAATSFRYFL